MKKKLWKVTFGDWEYYGYTEYFLHEKYAKKAYRDIIKDKDCISPKLESIIADFVLNVEDDVRDLTLSIEMREAKTGKRIKYIDFYEGLSNRLLENIIREYYSLWETRRRKKKK